MASYDKGDIVMMKKAHPCGSNRWVITRVGADIKMPGLWPRCDDDPAEVRQGPQEGH